jgi:hypothetical protein
LLEQDMQLLNLPILAIQLVTKDRYQGSHVTIW